jgi:hypothetical protein
MDWTSFYVFSTELLLPRKTTQTAPSAPPIPPVLRGNFIDRCWSYAAPPGPVTKPFEGGPVSAGVPAIWAR